MPESQITEAAMMAPVLTLFPKTQYDYLAEYPLGRKQIDLLCVPVNPHADLISVELKISNWRKHMASVNQFSS